LLFLAGEHKQIQLIDQLCLFRAGGFVPALPCPAAGIVSEFVGRMVPQTILIASKAHTTQLEKEAGNIHGCSRNFTAVGVARPCELSQGTATARKAMQGLGA
jgi:hypothetical protein